MPTEAFGIEEDLGFSYAKLKLAYPAWLLNEVKDFLVAAGWGFDEEDQGHGTYDMEFPYGAQITTVPDPLPDKVDMLDRSEYLRYEAYDPDAPETRTDLVRFCLYDPYRENPIANAEIEWVAMGLTIADTLDNLAGAIAAQTYFAIGEAGVYQRPPAFPGDNYWFIPLIADEGGTHSAPKQAGGLTILSGSPSGYWSIVGYTGGAGWHLTTSHLAASLDLWLLVNTVYPGALFRFQINDALAVDYPMWRSVADPALIEWEIAGSAKQFWLWTEDNYLDNCMVSLPYVFPDKGVTRAGVLAYGLGWRNTFLWVYGWTRLAINSGFVALTSAPAADRQAGLCYSYNIGPFRYGAGETLIENSFAMAPRADLSVSTSSRVFGKIWNAFVMRRDATLGERIFHDDDLYMCVSREAGSGRPVGSLWVRIE